MKYPNLNSLIKWHSYGLPAFAEHANVTTDLLEAVLRGEEELTASELWGIARFVGIDVGVLTQPELILMNIGKYQHWVKINDVLHRFYAIRDLRIKKCGKADTDLESVAYAVGCLVKNAEKGTASYCQYFAVIEELERNEWLYTHKDCASRPRGLRNKKAPATDQSTQGEK